MNRGLIVKTLCALLAWAWLWPGVAGGAEEYVARPACNPFLPVTLEVDDYGASMRHPFHKLRVTWDDYFKVWPKPREGYQQTTVAKLRASPTSFLHRKVEFDVYFNAHGGFFRPFVAEFHKDTHFNFSVWDHDTELWNKQQRADIYPFLYIDLRDDKIIQRLEKTPRFSGLHLYGEVKVVSEGFPWITIVDSEPLNEPQFYEGSLRDLELAFARVEKRDWPLATTALRAALNESLPLTTQFKVFEALGKCLLEQNLCESARETLIEGLRLYGGPRIQLPDALRRDVGCTKMLFPLTEADLRLNRDAEAQMAAELCVRFEPANPLGHVLLGLALAKQGQFREGLTEVDIAQRLAPEGKYLEARRIRSKIFGLMGNWEGAKAEIDQAILLRPNDAQLHIEAGDVLMAMKNYTLAQKEYELVSATLAPDRPEAYLRQAQAFRAMGDAALAANKKDEAGGFYAQALEKAKVAVQRDDLYAPAYGFQAELLRSIGKEAEATAVLEQAVAAGPKSFAVQEMLYERARAQGDWDKMEKACMAEVALRPADVALHVRLADIRAYRPTPDYAGAESEYAQASNLDPGNVNAWCRLAFVRNRLCMWKQALMAAQQATALDACSYYGWTELTIAQRQLGERGEAVKAARQAARLQNSVAARIALATTCLDRGDEGDVGQALELAKSAAADAQTDAERAAAQCVLGAALVANGSDKEALDAFRTADVSLGEDPWNNLWAGRALLHVGDAAGAKARFEKAMRAADPGVGKLMERVRKDAEKGLRDAEKRLKEAGENAKPVASVQTEAAPVAKTEAPPPAKTEAPAAAKVETPAPAKTETKSEAPAEKPAAKANTPPVIQAEPNSGAPVPVTAEPNPGPR
jgi:tetratricopeptide (TPR) repeat protein